MFARRVVARVVRGIAQRRCFFREFTGSKKLFQDFSKALTAANALTKHFADKAQILKDNPSIKMMVALPSMLEPVGMVFPRDTILDHFFQISRAKNSSPQMYLGYSGQGMSVSMHMSLNQFRQVDGVNYCVRACNVNFRRSSVKSSDENEFISDFSDAIGEYAGKDSADDSLRLRLDKRVAQLSDAFRYIHQSRIEMHVSAVPQGTLKQQSEQATEVKSTELVQYLPVLLIDHVNCLNPEFAITLIQSLFSFPYPVIFTVSERKGLDRIMEGAGVADHLGLHDFPSMSKAEMVTALMTPTNQYRLVFPSEQQSVVEVPSASRSYQVINDASDVQMKKKVALAKTNLTTKIDVHQDPVMAEIERSEIDLLVAKARRIATQSKLEEVDKHL